MMLKHCLFVMDILNKFYFLLANAIALLFEIILPAELLSVALNCVLMRSSPAC